MNASPEDTSNDTFTPQVILPTNLSLAQGDDKDAPAPNQPTQSLPILQTNIGYKLQRTGLPKRGTASLYTDKITITDENNQIVFSDTLGNMKRFRRSLSSMLFNTVTQRIELDFVSFKSVMVGEVLAGAAGMLAADSVGLPTAKEWQAELEHLGIKFKKFYLGFG